MPAYFHLTTSAYGLFIKDQLVGWMYLRGWQQVLYVEVLGVLPEYHGQGIENALLSFGENAARELRRGWLTMTVPLEDISTMQGLEAQGFRRGHWRVFHSEHPVPEISNGHISLKRTVGSPARRAYREFAEQDLQASEPDTALVQSCFLLQDPYYSRSGQHWLIETEGRQVGFLHSHGPSAHPIMILTALPDTWGSLDMLAIVKKALGTTVPETLAIRLGSNRHHDAARAILEPFGFEEHPADTIRMFKRIDNE